MGTVFFAFTMIALGALISHNISNASMCNDMREKGLRDAYREMCMTEKDRAVLELMENSN